MSLELRPITQRDAFDFIRRLHRHHGVPVGHLWSQAVQDADGNLVGVAVQVGDTGVRGLGLVVHFVNLLS